MRLPLPDYASPTPSRGMEDVNQPLAVAGAAAHAASAKGQVASALGHVAGIAEAWAEAEDKARATKAYADYHATVSNVHTQLTKNPTIAVDQLPPGVAYDQSRMEPDPEAPGQTRPRSVVPTWEVAPQIYDQKAKEAAAIAKGEARSRSSRAWLDAKIQESNTQVGGQVAGFSLNGRKAQMAGDYEEAIQFFVNNGQSNEAVKGVDAMVANGLLTPSEGVKRKQRVRNDAANLMVGQAIADTNDPAQLRLYADKWLSSKGELTDEQAIAMSGKASAKAERLEKEAEKITTKAEKIASSVALTNFVTGIRLDKRLPTKAEVHLAISKMTPEDARSALALYDRKDGGEGGQSSPEAKRAITNRIIGIMVPGVGGSADERIRAARAEADRLYSIGQLSEKDWRQAQTDAKNMGDRITTDDPTYKLATDAVYANIAKNPKGSMLSSSGSESRYAVAVEMEIALFNAKNADPKLDSVKWVSDNQAKFQTKADKAITDKLRKGGLTAFIATDQNVGYDPYKTEDNLRKAFRSKAITRELYERGMNLVLEKVPAPTEAKK